MIKLRRFMFYD